MSQWTRAACTNPISCADGWLRKISCATLRMLCFGVIPGNSDTRTPELRVLDAPLILRRLRVVPLSNSTRTVCLRLELYGCPYEGATYPLSFCRTCAKSKASPDPLQTYSAPTGSAANGVSFVDSSYDGSASNSIATGGLGRLSDGVVGEDTEDSHPHRWELLKFVMGVSLQGFSRIVVSFSANGADFSSRVLECVPQRLTSTSWVRVPVQARVASTIQLRLYYPLDASWLLLSEVRFESSEVRFDLPYLADEDRSDGITYFSVDESDSEGRLGTMVTSDPVLLCLLILTLTFPLTVFCLYRKRDKIRTASPGSHLTFDGSVFKSVSPSTYQMARDNMENALLEKCPMIVIASEYAEPDFSW
ncbi:hypothetical protein ANCDUO_23767 [Ancylostoma duodenale]|uniref:F5/8 type C domain-containing protein n=1 Tax=Ancylostoma duodenale TaxID=51022 RepID=A0A0C2C8W1_9BILA|nr:hypothetical protein ANCDUO_23767 [Ancylostoma duodenale]